MIPSKFTCPWPRERKFQPRHGISEVDVGTQQAGAPVQSHRRVLHVHMVHPAGLHKVLEEQVGGHALPQKMARVEVQSELRVILELLQQADRGVVVKGDSPG